MSGCRTGGPRAFSIARDAVLVWQPGCAGFAVVLTHRTAELSSVRQAHNQKERQPGWMSVAEFYKTSKVWVVDFTYDGHPRRWLKALPDGTDAAAEMATLLRDLYADRCRIVSVRAATPEEETQYIRGDLPRNIICPTGRRAPGK